MAAFMLLEPVYCYNASAFILESNCDLPQYGGPYDSQLIMVVQLRCDMFQVHTTEHDQTVSVFVQNWHALWIESLSAALHALPAQVDAWALGTIVYELFTGLPPFNDASRTVTCTRIVNAEPNYPSKMNAVVVDFVRRALVKVRIMKQSVACCPVVHNQLDNLHPLAT